MTKPFLRVRRIDMAREDQLGRAQRDGEVRLVGAGSTRRALLAAVASCGAWTLAASRALADVSPASAGPAVVDALTRPSSDVRSPGRAVLLAAAAAGGGIVAVGERGLVAVSHDQGATWTQRPTPVSVTLTAVRFADDQFGVAVGHGGTVLLSSDGGQNWRVALDGRKAAQLALDAAMATNDPAASDSASRLVADGADKPFLDLMLAGRSEIVIVGAYGLAFGSSDGGRSWSSWIGRLDNPRGLHAYAVRHRERTVAVAGEQGLVLLSGDRGRSFRKVATPYRGSFFTAELLGEQDLIVAGLRGNVWRSRDGGGSWASIHSPMPASITNSILLPGGEVLFANQAGFAMRLVEDKLEPINTAALPPINALAMADGRRLLALTPLGVLPLQGAISVKG